MTQDHPSLVEAGVSSIRHSFGHEKHALSDDQDSILKTEDSICDESSEAPISSTERPNEDLLSEESIGDEYGYVDLEDLDDDTYSLDLFDWLHFRCIIIKSLPPYNRVDKSLLKHNLLPPKAKTTSPYTLVLDLDETLVHCVMEPIENYDVKFDVSDARRISYRFNIMRRSFPFTHPSVLTLMHF